MAILIYVVVPVDASGFSLTDFHKTWMLPTSGSFTANDPLLRQFNAAKRARMRVESYFHTKAGHAGGVNPSRGVFGFHFESSDTSPQQQRYLRNYAAYFDGDSYVDRASKWRVCVTDVAGNFDAVGPPVGALYYSWSDKSLMPAYSRVEMFDFTVEANSNTLDDALAFISATPPAAFPYALPE